MIGQLATDRLMPGKGLLLAACFAIAVGLAGCGEQDSISLYSLGEFGRPETGDMMDQERARGCALVVRGRRLGDSDARKYLWADVEVLDVLNDPDPHSTWRGSRIHVAYRRGDEGPPLGQVCTMYLVPYRVGMDPGRRHG